MQALGNDPDKLNVDIIQMVRLVSDGKEVKMSKRLGNATTINELCDSVGVDAARYFFVQRALDSHLDFDIELAKRQSMIIRYIMHNMLTLVCVQFRNRQRI